MTAMKDRKGRKIISQLDMTLEQIDGKPEPRTRTLLRSMIAALDAGDDQTFFDCYELLTKIVLEMLLKPNNTGQRSAAQKETYE